MPRLSIVIPCQTCDERFESTLASVLQNRPEKSEILVVFSGVYEDPYDLREEVRFIEMPAHAPLLALINVGIEQSGGEVVHLLQCGIEVEDGWTRAPLEQFERGAVAAVAPIVLPRPPGNGRGVAGVRYGLGGTRHVCEMPVNSVPAQVPPILGPSLQAAFYRREAIRQVGGMDAAIGPEWADVDLALSLRAAGHRAVCEPGSRVFATAPPPARPPRFHDAVRGERHFWKHAARHGLLRSLVAHAFHVAGEALRTLVRPSTIGCLAGRLYGCVRRTSRQPGPYEFSEKTSRPRRRPRGHSANGGHLTDGGGESAQFSDGRRRHVA